MLIWNRYFNILESCFLIWKWVSFLNYSCRIWLSLIIRHLGPPFITNGEHTLLWAHLNVEQVYPYLFSFRFLWLSKLFIDTFTAMGLCACNTLLAFTVFVSTVFYKKIDNSYRKCYYAYLAYVWIFALLVSY